MKVESEKLDQGYSEVTSGIKISVIPEPNEDNSDPQRYVFAFSYTITIENLGAETVQLIERHWNITSGGVQMAEVVGPGVVGKQPTLEPGDTFQYTSGAVIEDPIGSMEGRYTFRTTDGRNFFANIPKFVLNYPVLIH